MEEERIKKEDKKRDDVGSLPKGMSPEDIVQFCRNYLGKVRYPPEGYGLYSIDGEKTVHNNRPTR